MAENSTAMWKELLKVIVAAFVAAITSLGLYQFQRNTTERDPFRTLVYERKLRAYDLITRDIARLAVTAYKMEHIRVAILVSEGKMDEATKAIQAFPSAQFGNPFLTDLTNAISWYNVAAKNDATEEQLAQFRKTMKEVADKKAQSISGKDYLGLVGDFYQQTSVLAEDAIANLAYWPDISDIITNELLPVITSHKTRGESDLDVKALINLMAKIDERFRKDLGLPALQVNLTSLLQ